MKFKLKLILLTLLITIVILSGCTNPYSNHKPTIDSIDDKTVRVGENLSIPIKFSDPDNDVLNISVTPQDMSQYFNEKDGIFSWTPKEKDLGVKKITFSVSDGEKKVEKDVTININMNNFPSVDIEGENSYNEGDLVELTVLATDADNDPLTYDVEGDFAKYFDTTTNKIEWPTTKGDAGNYEIIFTVSDGLNIKHKTYNLIIEPEENIAPYFTSIAGESVEGDINLSTEEGKNLNFTVKAKDDNSEQLSYYASGDLIEYFDTDNQTFNWTPENGDYGDYEIEFVVDDGQTTARKAVQINVNDKPVLDCVDEINVNEGETVNFNVSAFDNENSDDELTFSCSGDLTEYFNTDTRTFSWDTTKEDIGVYDISFKITDSYGSTDNKTVNVTVNNIPEIQYVIGKEVDNPYNIENEIFFKLKAIDDDSNLKIEMVCWYKNNDNSPVNFDENHFIYNSNDNIGVFSWTPISGDEGEYTITFKVTDTYEATNLKSIVLKVQ